MITYLKNEFIVVKVNEDEKTLRIINNTSNGLACIFETNVNMFADVTVLKKGEGFFVDATEEEYLSVKEQVRLKFLEF